ncbi:MAG: hypothetical protein Q7J34_03575 [Bacteroidales bacterium]|nr:hypothetical protein [Bacteroidales bacterium]
MAIISLIYKTVFGGINSAQKWLASFTYGQYALASFIICALTGFPLLIPYNVDDAYKSLSLMILANPAAAFFRNMHYLSAQFFIVSTMVHIWKYIVSHQISQLKHGVWVRLVFAVIASFFVMITGFILKGDADSQQALRIIFRLFDLIPLIGGLISAFFLGDGDHYQLIYYHHISTATLFLLLIIYEHSRKIWARKSLMIGMVLLFSVLSLFIQAPLHDGKNEVMKGPWYFLGLQELLHWLESPALSLLFIAMFFLILYLVYYPRFKKAGKNILLFFFFAYIFLMLIGVFFRGAEWKWVNPLNYKTETHITTPSIDILPLLDGFNPDSVPMTGSFRESCISCHSDMRGFSASHDPKAIGCSSCHLGNPYAYNGDVAHHGMILVPGNLSEAEKTCGYQNCHPGIPARVSKSIMSTLSGMISVNRWVFNESENPSEISHVSDLTNSPADMHLRNLCSGCHLGSIKSKPGPMGSFPKGGGCNACHLQYTDSVSKDVIARYWSKTIVGSKPKMHPSLSINVDDKKCFHCHNRSGRISTNYTGWAEMVFYDKSVEKNRKHRISDGDRTFVWKGDDVHHKAGMSCTDCHQAIELMGDGHVYAHKEAQVKVECTDCHGSTDHLNVEATSLSSESQKIIALNNYLKSQKGYLRNKKSGLEIINAKRMLGYTEVYAKQKQKTLIARNPAIACSEGKAHQRLSCSACHTAWGSSCVGCHVSFNKEAPGYDHLKNKLVQGSWTEAAGKFEHKPPALGIRLNKNGKEEIHTFIPGMVLNINVPDKTGERIIFKRLYAPAEPHTISGKARSCKSCHYQPFALGYGEGELEYSIKNNTARWTFFPKYANEGPDQLPADAWTGFLKERKDAAATRPGYRPFNIKEQKNILLAGACLQCHLEDSKIMKASLHNFDSLQQHLSRRCILPEK